VKIRGVMKFPALEASHRNRVLGGLLVIAATLGSIVAITSALGTSTRHTPDPVERYLAAANGATVVFHVDAPAQPTLRRTINVAVRSVGDIIDRQEAAASIIGLLQRKSERESFSFADIVQTRILVTRILDEQTQVVTRGLSIGLLHGDQFAIVEQEFPGLRVVFAPPLPVLNSAADAGITQQYTGNVQFPLTSASAPYSATLTIQKRGPVTINGAQRIDDCIVALTTLHIGAIDLGASTSTYCSNLGEVAFEARNAAGDLLNQGAAVRLPTQPSESAVTAADLDLAARRYDRVNVEPRSSWVYSHSERISSIYAAPTVDHDSVFVGNFLGEVVALDRANGALRWRFQTGGPVFAAPIVAQDHLLVGSSDRSLHALRAADGAWLWSFTTPDAIVASPAVSGPIAYVGSENGALYSVDVQSGALLHSFQTGGAIAAAPAPHGDVVYVASESGALFALDAFDLSLRWVFDAESPLATPPLVTANAIFIGDHGETLYAVSPKPENERGRMLWSRKIYANIQGLLLAPNNMVMVTSSNRIHAYDAADGALKWSTAKSSFFGPAFVDGDRLYVAAQGGVETYSTNDGRRLSRMPTTEGGRPSAVRASGSWLYVGDARGDVWALPIAAEKTTRTITLAD